MFALPSISQVHNNNNNNNNSNSNINGFCAAYDIQTPQL